MTTCDDCGTALPDTLDQYSREDGEVSVKSVGVRYCPWCGKKR